MVILGHNLGNSQVSVYRTIGPTLVLYLFAKLTNLIHCTDINYLFPRSGRDFAHSARGRLQHLHRGAKVSGSYADQEIMCLVDDN